MDIQIFNELMSLKKKPWQELGEWRCYLEFCFNYFRQMRISSPMVVELGVASNKQKRFYQELLGADHIGIDINPRRCPDILADTHSKEAKKLLLKALGGRTIDLLYIDAGHLYEDAKMDLETFGPMSRHLIALHDVCHVDPKHPEVQVKKLWDGIAMKLTAYTKIIINAKPNHMGIGILMRNRGDKNSGRI